MKSIFSQNEKQEIITMYKNKVEIDEIVSAFNTDEHYVRLILKEHEIDRHYNIWSEELYERLIKLYSQKKTCKEIGYILNICPNGITKVLRKKEIETRSYMENNRRHKRDSEYFDNINTPNKAYVLGLIYADGNNYIWGKKHCLTISLQDKDYDLLERVRQELGYEGRLRLNPLHEKNDKHRNQYILCITDEYMCKRLKEIGVVQRKSLVLRFPKYLRPDLIRHFVRGYFDGDGTISFNKNSNKHMAGIVGTFEFVSVISTILRSMFVKNYIYKPKQTNDSNTYEMRTTGNLSAYKFLSWIYRDCDIKMDRKYRLYLEFCERYTNPKGGIKSL